MPSSADPNGETFFGASQFWVEDLSSNGTFVNMVKLGKNKRSRLCHHGERASDVLHAWLLHVESVTGGSLWRQTIFRCATPIRSAAQKAPNSHTCSRVRYFALLRDCVMGVILTRARLCVLSVSVCFVLAVSGQHAELAIGCLSARAGHAL